MRTYAITSSISDRIAYSEDVKVYLNEALDMFLEDEQGIDPNIYENIMSAQDFSLIKRDSNGFQVEQQEGSGWIVDDIDYARSIFEGILEDVVQGAAEVFGYIV